MEVQLCFVQDSYHVLLLVHLLLLCLNHTGKINEVTRAPGKYPLGLFCVLVLAEEGVLFEVLYIVLPDLYTL